LSGPAQTRLKRLQVPQGSVDLFSARHLRQRFARHSHRRFPVGVIEGGALSFYYRGENLVAPAGQINLANPGEPHTGHPLIAEQGWSYRMFYCSRSLLTAANQEFTGQADRLPYFASGVLDDPALALRLRAIHQALADEKRGSLATETLLLQALVSLIARHADHRPRPLKQPASQAAVELCREYLEANYERDVSLSELAALCGLSTYHLATIFRQQTGLPPHLYLNQVRVRRAKELLTRGLPLADTALMAGFFDQSHFTRRFKAITGMTPGMYKKCILKPQS
jgi:AraC-like DNA-binding protein